MKFSNILKTDDANYEICHLNEEDFVKQSDVAFDSLHPRNVTLMHVITKKI